MKKSGRRNRNRILWSLLLGGLGGSAFYVLAILHQASSTAGIGLLFTPFVFGFCAVAWAAWVWCFHRAFFDHRLFGSEASSSIFRTLATVSAALLLVLTTATVGGELLRTARFLRLQSPGASPKVLERAYHRASTAEDSLHLAAIAGNGATPPWILLELARSSDPLLHEKRSGWAQLVDDDSLAVVRKVLRNPNAPDEIVGLLAKSLNDYVLGDVAGDRRADEEILRAIDRRSDSYLVDWGLARNHNTPPEILERIAREYDLSVGYLATHDLAGNPNTPSPILEELAEHDDGLVRSAAARNPVLAPELLKRLATDPQQTVRMSVCRNPSITPALLDQLAQDGSDRVRRSALKASRALEGRSEE